MPAKLLIKLGLITMMKTLPETIDRLSVDRFSLLKCFF
nr:MAG TPA: hypothetical protein [Caudoviricetes sp.]